MPLSFFMNKEEKPDAELLKKVLGNTWVYWNQIINYVHTKYPTSFEEWNYPGKNYGWSFRVKDKKRAIIYLLPKDGNFKVAMVFGKKATEEALNSDINSEIKKIIEDAPVYAEGRGFRIGIKNDAILDDIKKLIDIKLNH